MGFGHLEVLHAKFHDRTISNLGDYVAQTNKQTDRQTNRQTNTQTDKANYYVDSGSQYYVNGRDINFRYNNMWTSWRESNAKQRASLKKTIILVIRVR